MRRPGIHPKGPTRAWLDRVPANVGADARPFLRPAELLGSASTRLNITLFTPMPRANFKNRDPGESRVTPELSKQGSQIVHDRPKSNAHARAIQLPERPLGRKPGRLWDNAVPQMAAC